ncbi:hypothetical protein RUM43_007057 [Polyplax serrata]|uniref:Uncharacterized protein n=1 Tax=Polyplax serrata TaxID=468196 RepID=A0AAN8Q5M2_POLSC
MQQGERRIIYEGEDYSTFETPTVRNSDFHPESGVTFDSKTYGQDSVSACSLLTKLEGWKSEMQQKKTPLLIITIRGGEEEDELESDVQRVVVYLSENIQCSWYVHTTE